MFCDILGGKEASPESKLVLKNAEAAFGKIEQATEELVAVKKAETWTIGKVADVLPNLGGIKAFVVTRVGGALETAARAALGPAWDAIESRMATCQRLAQGEPIEDAARALLLKDIRPPPCNPIK